MVSDYRRKCRGNRDNDFTSGPRGMYRTSWLSLFSFAFHNMTIELY